MTHKEFLSWCNKRACDGYWSFEVAMCCTDIADRLYSVPFWRREKEWLKIKDEIEIEKVVLYINAEIEALKGGANE